MNAGSALDGRCLYSALASSPSSMRKVRPDQGLRPHIISQAGQFLAILVLFCAAITGVCSKRLQPEVWSTHAGTRDVRENSAAESPGAGSHDGAPSVQIRSGGIEQNSAVGLEEFNFTMSKMVADQVGIAFVAKLCFPRDPTLMPYSFEQSSLVYNVRISGIVRFVSSSEHQPSLQVMRSDVADRVIFFSGGCDGRPGVPIAYAYAVQNSQIVSASFSVRASELDAVLYVVLDTCGVEITGETELSVSVGPMSTGCVGRDAEPGGQSTDKCLFNAAPNCALQSMSRSAEALFKKKKKGLGSAIVGVTMAIALSASALLFYAVAKDAIKDKMK